MAYTKELNENRVFNFLSSREKNPIEVKETTDLRYPIKLTRPTPTAQDFEGLKGILDGMDECFDAYKTLKHTRSSITIVKTTELSLALERYKQFRGQIKERK